MTLIEVIVAMAVFAILALASTAIVWNGLHTGHESSNRVYAASLAAAEMDTLRAQDPTNIPLAAVSRTVNTPRGTFTITDTAEWLSVGATTGSCDSGNGARQAYLALHIEVWGTPLPKTSAVKLDTLLAPTQNSFDPTDGNISVKITKADGSAQPGVTVSITNVSGDTSTHAPQVTGNDGCAFFPGLNASSVWTVTVSQSGYTTTTNKASYSQQVTVSQAATSPLVFAYDQAATLSVQLPGGMVTPTGMPITYASTYITNQVATPGAFPYSLTPLFPVPSGYQVWLGSCNDADPIAPGRLGGTVGNRIAYQATAGGSSAAVLNGVEIDFADVAAGQMTVSHPAEANSSYCSSGVSYTVNVNNNTKLLLPYGAWTLTDKAGNTVSMVLDPSDTQKTVSMSTGVIT